ncbi:hypothetical protein TIFTF001_008912 [Ficus carica]|uniref:Uncharacterized protein n=1 Tax=Ficus carica TaxID=3494 RepID=A0AA88D391_FICCA|nr:hypothetical protein TIFTF001_008912 [Ficus carica]
MLTEHCSYKYAIYLSPIFFPSTLLFLVNYCCKSEGEGFESGGLSSLWSRGSRIYLRPILARRSEGDPFDTWGGVRLSRAIGLLWKIGNRDARSLATMNWKVVGLVMEP